MVDDSSMPGGAITQSDRPCRVLSPMSILRKAKPSSMRCRRRRPISRPSSTEVVSQ